MPRMFASVGIMIRVVTVADSETLLPCGALLFAIRFASFSEIDKRDPGERVAGMRYISPEEMMEAESRALSRGIGVGALMENAGAAVAKAISDRIEGKGDVLVVCGTGNNGGDGFVAARKLSDERRVRVLVLASDPSKVRTAEARLNLGRLEGGTIEIAFAGDAEAVKTRAGWIQDAKVILDAILGTGVRGEVREPMATAILLMNESKATRVSIDIPSGLDPASGSVSSAGAVRADITITLHAAKTGLQGREEYTGDVVVVPIGISADW